MFSEESASVRVVKTEPEFMYVIATANQPFALRWSSIIGNPSLTDTVGTVADLNRYLGLKAVDVIVLDMNLPGAKQKEVLKAIHAFKKQAKLIIAGVTFTPEAELAALATGVVACCSATMPEGECRKILDVVSKKGVWLSSSGIPALMERLKDFSTHPVNKAVEAQENSSAFSRVLDKLTKREQEIARLVTTGANNKNIARQLSISERTVKAHLSSIFLKLHIRDRLQLVVCLSGKK